MKLRTTKYMFKEGFVNVYRNMLMSLASISVVIAALIILGVFWISTVTLSYNTKKLEQQPEMKVFCDPELDESQTASIQIQIRNDKRIKEFQIETKKDAFEKAKEMLGKDKDVLEGLDEDFMSVAFIVKLNDPMDCEDVVKELSAFPGVENVRYSKDEIEIVSKIVNVVQIGSTFVVILLTGIAIFIISNTIKITLFARRKEINIMKYIGATDWFIRWPFLIEGVIIGILGAVISFGIVSLGYSFVADVLAEKVRIIDLASVEDIGFDLIIIFVVIGSIVGATGSVVSIRKYLRV